jgi:glyoxylase-like metal-dependent hydrolase (beta-lactamase superfamily II)
MLQGRGGNIGVSVGVDGILIVDDQFAPLTERIVAAIKTLTDKPVRFVINTHWHGDHTGGNENLGKAGAVIIAHDNVRKRMSVEQFNRDLNWKTPPSPKGALPIVTFAESVTLHLNGDTVHVTHVPPAHTDGDSIVHFANANVVHMGDLFFSEMYPFIDRGSGGTLDGVIGAADKALSMANEATKIIPGHGSLATKADLKAYRDMLFAIRDRVSTLIKEGKSLSDVQAAQPTKEYDAKWGGGFQKPDQFVALVYSTLKNED